MHALLDAISTAYTQLSFLYHTFNYCDYILTANAFFGISTITYVIPQDIFRGMIYTQKAIPLIGTGITFIQILKTCISICATPDIISRYLAIRLPVLTPKIMGRYSSLIPKKNSFPRKSVFLFVTSFIYERFSYYYNRVISTNFLLRWQN